MNNQNSSLTRILLGSLFLLAGIYFLADNLELIHFQIPHYIFSFPTFVIVIGILMMVNSGRFGFGLVVTLFGVIWMATRFIPNIGFGEIFVPFIIIVIGIRLLFRNKEGGFKCCSFFKRGTNETHLDKLNDIAIFGGAEKQFVSNKFQGGSVTAIFGGSEIDLTQCKLAADKQVIDVLVCFGGSTIIVPRDWNIIIDVVPIFGGFSHKNKRNNSASEIDSGTLVIKGIAIFGGGEVKSY